MRPAGGGWRWSGGSACRLLDRDRCEQRRVVILSPFDPWSAGSGHGLSRPMSDLIRARAARSAFSYAAGNSPSSSARRMMDSSPMTDVEEVSVAAVEQAGSALALHPFAVRLNEIMDLPIELFGAAIVDAHVDAPSAVAVLPAKEKVRKEGKKAG
jgi:hypothetical protein